MEVKLTPGTGRTAFDVALFITTRSRRQTERGIFRDALINCYTHHGPDGAAITMTTCRLFFFFFWRSDHIPSHHRHQAEQ